jgi:hypothetical protein
MMSKLENKMTIKMVAENFGVLQRNGYDLVCPIVPPQTIRQVVKGSLGQPQEQISVQKTSCNTVCPLIKINDDDSVSVCCGAVEVVHKIEKIIELLDSNEQNAKILNFGNPKDIN